MLNSSLKCSQNASADTYMEDPLQSQFTDSKNKGAHPDKCSDEWPTQLKENCEDILQSLNLEALIPHLLKNDLLTQSEYQELEVYKEMPRRQNRYFLLTVLPRKGREAFNMFIECLKAEKGHLGHRDLVKTLCNKKK